MTLTGAGIVVEHLIREGCRYSLGIPGHGNLTFTDALRLRQDKIKTVQVMHESAGVHMVGLRRADRIRC